MKQGDKIATLNDSFEGEIIEIKGKIATIETTDGFMMDFEINELLLINDQNELLNGIKRFNPDQIKAEKSIPKPRSFEKIKKEKREAPVPEFDLHIEKLVKNKNGMTNYDILSLQADTAQRHLEFAIKNRIPKIVFIHGVGEGVLKAELDFMLGRYEGVDFREANYQKYGQGATEVFIKQNKN
jgi:dsDNA-specific endonuclease/ATPase MutS2